MKMRRSLASCFAGAAAMLAASQNANAAGFGCSASLAGVISGNKTLTIQLDDHGKKKYAVDDDGYLVLSLLAAHCNGQIPWSKLELTEEQRKCADDAQVNFKYDEKVSIYSAPQPGQPKSPAEETVFTACGFRVSAMWQKAEAAIGDAPLKCADEVKPIVSRAVARFAEFSKENMTPTELAKHGVPANMIAKYLEADKQSGAQAKAFEAMLSSSPVKIKAFKEWVENLQPAIEGHSYHMLPSADATPTADTLQSASQILMNLGARLPDIPQSRCGMFPSDLVDQLKDATWKPTGAKRSAPATGVSQ